MLAMKYEDPTRLSRAEIELGLSSSRPEDIATALVAIVLKGEDWRRCQGLCLEFLNHADPTVRRASAICFGHIARIHGRLDTDVVLLALRQHVDDPEIAGSVSDALDDIATFL